MNVGLDEGAGGGVDIFYGFLSIVRLLLSTLAHGI